MLRESPVLHRYKELQAGSGDSRSQKCWVKIRQLLSYPTICLIPLSDTAPSGMENWCGSAFQLLQLNLID